MKFEGGLLLIFGKRHFISLLKDAGFFQHINRNLKKFSPGISSLLFRPAGERSVFSVYSEESYHPKRDVTQIHFHKFVFPTKVTTALWIDVNVTVHNEGSVLCWSLKALVLSSCFLPEPSNFWSNLNYQLSSYESTEVVTPPAHYDMTYWNQTLPPSLKCMFPLPECH